VQHAVGVWLRHEDETNRIEISALREDRNRSLRAVARPKALEDLACLRGLCAAVRSERSEQDSIRLRERTGVDGFSDDGEQGLLFGSRPRLLRPRRDTRVRRARLPRMTDELDAWSVRLRAGARRSPAGSFGAHARSSYETRRTERLSPGQRMLTSSEHTSFSVVIAV
jgi:hypothetical protein